jgi:hypothetical protein
MEPTTKKILKTTKTTVKNKVEKNPALTKTASIEKAPKKVIPAKVAKPARVVKTVKAAVKNEEAVTPKEPTRKVSAPKVVKPAKIVKLAKAASVTELVETARPEVSAKTAKPGLSKPRRLSSGQRTFIRRLKQLARQEGTTYHAPLIRRAAAK